MITFINDSTEMKLGLNFYKKSAKSIGVIIRWDTKNIDMHFF